MVKASSEVKLELLSNTPTLAVLPSPAVPLIVAVVPAVEVVPVNSTPMFLVPVAAAWVAVPSTSSEVPAEIERALRMLIPWL